MSFETKEEVLEKILAKEKPLCRHCSVEMCLWEVPPHSFSDGLGWGTPYLYVCFNDECPYYVEGWEWMETKYDQKASYRHRYDPNTGQTGPLPVWSSAALRGRIIE